MAFQENWYLYRKACVLTRDTAAVTANRSSSPDEVLFLHGRSEDGLCWNPLTERLSSQSNCHSLELPGSGRSFCLDDREMAFFEYVDLVTEVIRASIEIRPQARWLLVGHDLGALIVQFAALEVAHTVDLVLINPVSLSPIARPSWWWFSKPVLERSVLRRLVETWPGPAARKHWRTRMKSFPGSVLVLSSAVDPLISTAVARGIFNTYPHAEYYEHSVAGHDLPIEDPDWVCEKVKTFLFRTSPQCGKTAA